MNNRSARVIIGAHFGDEGKGLLTDFFAAQAPSDSVVVRFNGGAQAGHTVVTPQGERHVFGHFGAGSFCGSSTFLSEFFVCNPILFLRELQVLRTLGTAPSVLVDPRAPVTTPYDMLINQIVEESRGAARHGSCGLGFGETIERNLTPEVALTVADLPNQPLLEARLQKIRKQYVPARLARLGIDVQVLAEHQEALSDVVLEAFMAEVDRFLGAIQVTQNPLADGRSTLLFEGAQGLLLDQDMGYFPHVTRSNTGLRNVLVLAEALDIDRLDVTYATRTYVTRHGAGPLAHETDGLPYPGIIDLTNRPNRFQGTLRFGLLDLDLLANTVARDLADAKGTSVAIRPSLCVTCIDQLEGAPARFIQQGIMKETHIEELLLQARAVTGAQTLYTASGPSRQTVEEYQLTPTSGRRG